MDLDEMLRVDRCRDMDELIFLRYRINGATRNFTSGKSHICVLAQRAAAATRGLKWFYLLSRRNTFVGGTSALLVCFKK